MRLVSNLKNLLVSSERKPRRILAGPFKDIVMGLSLRSQTQIYLGLFEKEIHPWLNRLSQGIATAIDIGAAHGEYTLYFLQKTRATKVLAFEPDAGLLSCLNENLALNGIDQLERLEISTKFVGISNTEHEIRLDSLAALAARPLLHKNGRGWRRGKGTQRSEHNQCSYRCSLAYRDPFQSTRIAL